MSRFDLPHDFVDRVSEEMLRAPVKQFLFAQAVYANESRAQLTAAGIDFGRVPVDGGAAVLSLEQQQLMLAQSPLGGMVRVVNDYDRGGFGHTIRINRPVFGGGQYSEGARSIAANQSISLSPIPLQGEQVAITVRRIVGPASASGSGPQPIAIDRFDASLSVHSLAQQVAEALVYDRHAYLDAVIAARFDAAANNTVVRPGGLSSDSAFPVDETPLDLNTLFRAREIAEDNSIPRFEDGRYRVILSPIQMRQLTESSRYAQLSAMHEAKNALYQRPVEIDDLVIMSSAAITRDTTTVSGISIQRGMLIGRDAVGYVSTAPCEARSSNDDNYAETLRLIWCAYEGHAVLDNRFAVGIRSAVRV